MNKALLVIDVQKDFCEGGSLAVEGGNAVAFNITSYLEDHNLDYALVVATQDWHISPGGHWSKNPDYVDSWPVHCRAYSRGADLNDMLSPEFIDVTVRKGMFNAAYSGFEGVYTTHNLEKVLERFDIDEVDVCGIATDYCVRATALDSARLGFNTRVLLNLTAAVHPENLEQVVVELRQNGIEVVKLEQNAS